MKLFKIILTSLLIILFFNGCKNDKYVFLSDEDLALMLYSEGQEIKFKNASGSILKFTASSHSRGYIERDGAQNESTNINFSLVNDTVSGEKGIISVQASSSGTTMTVKLPHFDGTLYPLLSIPVTDTIGGITYSDITLGTALTVSNIKFIKNIYYSKTAGFLKLVDYNDAAWNRFN